MNIGTTRPYPPTGLTSARWLEIPPTRVALAALTSTQDGVHLSALFSDAEPWGGDAYPHAVSYAGQLYLEDGHTRVTRALLRSETSALIRVYYPVQEAS